jgi:hypothetical protein
MRNYDSSNDDNDNEASSNVITSTAELDKELLDESITYYKLKNASKWEVDDDDYIDSSKNEVTTYTYVFTLV